MPSVWYPLWVHLFGRGGAIGVYSFWGVVRDVTDVIDRRRVRKGRRKIMT